MWRNSAAGTFVSFSFKHSPHRASQFLFSKTLRTSGTLRVQSCIVDACVSVCLQLHSLPKQWGGICRVAHKDIPKGSRCSFIKLSNSVEQREGIGKQRREGRDRKNSEEGNAGERKGGRCGGEVNGWRLSGRHTAHNVCPVMCMYSINQCWYLKHDT